MKQLSTQRGQAVKKTVKLLKKNIWNENFKSLHEINDTLKADYDKVI